MSSLISRLKSDDVREKTEATYATTRDDIEKHPEIINLMRNNLYSGNDDLVEITIMRLGIRANDLLSLDKIIDLSAASSNTLVISASIFAMSAIAESFSSARKRVQARLMAMKADIADHELTNIIQRELDKLGVIDDALRGSLTHSRSIDQPGKPGQ